MSNPNVTVVIGCRGETPEEFVAALDAAIANPAGQIEAPAAVLLAPIPREQLTSILNRTVGEPPRRSAVLIPALAGLFTGGSGIGLGGVISHNVDVYRYNSRIKAVCGILSAVVLARPTVGLSHAERAILSALARTYAAGGMPPDVWSTTFTRLVWNDGACMLVKPVDIAANKHVPLAEDALRTIMKATQPGHAVVLEEAAKLVAVRGKPSAVGALTTGARWMTADDRAASRVYTNDPAKRGLLLGVADDGALIRFAGNESLITIGGPGTGKTQAQVIPNLSIGAQI